MTGLVPCPSWPPDYRCGTKVEPGRLCSTCHRAKRAHGDNHLAALDAQFQMEAAEIHR